MTSNVGPRQMGEFPNFNFEDGSVDGWGGTRSIFEGNSNDGLGANNYCMETTGRWSSSGWNSTKRRGGDNFIPVDTSETWTLSYRIMGYQNGTDGTPPWHYLGFTGFDKNKAFVDLRNCGGVGNTYLSRDLNVGDSYAYIQSNSSWYTSNNAYYFKNLCLYPPTHPDYSTPHRYTRIGFGDYNLYYRDGPVLQPEGDYRLTLANSSLNPITYNYSAYPTPAGTPVMNGRAGGTYNYTFSRRQYTVSAGWQTMQATFTGESRNSGQPFRYAVKYIRSMILHNYALSGTARDSLCHWDRMLFIKNNNNRYNLD
jgi:hypothetical protein